MSSRADAPAPPRFRHRRKPGRAAPALALRVARRCPELRGALRAPPRSWSTSTARPRPPWRRALAAPPTRGRHAHRAHRPADRQHPQSTCSTAAPAPVPVGVPGELYIGGAGLARGYLGRPELTAERFVPTRSRARASACTAPATSSAGRPDGRARVPRPPRPPGEAARLPHRAGRDRGRPRRAPRRCARPSWSCARTTGRRQAPGGLRVAPAGDGPEPGELRAFLRERLPEYMVPLGLRLLDALPLTPNGKVDRAALPAPEGARPSWRRRLRRPRNAEEALAEIWAQVLGLERVGVHDNFFELGGGLHPLDPDRRPRGRARAAPHPTPALRAPNGGRAGRRRGKRPHRRRRPGRGHGRGALTPDPALVLRAGARRLPPLQPGRPARGRARARPPPPPPPPLRPARPP